MDREKKNHEVAPGGARFRNPLINRKALSTDSHHKKETQAPHRYSTRTGTPEASHGRLVERHREHRHDNSHRPTRGKGERTRVAGCIEPAEIKRAQTASKGSRP